jgi:1-acyl-sn-glycerol-3-phosphate acyltransferase
MGEGKLNRAVEQGKARTSDLKARVPDFRERVPELKALGAEELRHRGAELRVKGGELRARGGELARHYSNIDVSWARCDLARTLREGLLRFGLGPMMDYYLRRRAVGRDVFKELTPPVIFVANHSSHLDTPTILRALPRKWMNRTAVAAAADYFYDSRWKASGVALLFNTVPLGRNGGGLGNGATDHVDRIIAEGWNLLMFPEGTRSRHGEIGKVRSGAAVIAAQHGIDIVPIYVGGTHAAMPKGQNWPKRKPGRVFSRRHKVEVRFGRPIELRDDSDRHEVMDEVRGFWERKGRPQGVSAPPVAHDAILIHRVLRDYEARHAAETVLRFEPDAPAGEEPAGRSASAA